MNKKERIEKIEIELAELKKEVTDEEQWEPKGGKWWVQCDAGVMEAERSYERSRSFGVERPTKQQAEKAFKEMRPNHRLLAYVDEFDPGWQADWDDNREHKYYVYKDMDDKKWYLAFHSSSSTPGVVYMSPKCAEGLARKLNSGEVVL